MISEWDTAPATIAIASTAARRNAQRCLIRREVDTLPPVPSLRRLSGRAPRLPGRLPPGKATIERPHRFPDRRPGSEREID
jgi:hypothetical protein